MKEQNMKKKQRKKRVGNKWKTEQGVKKKQRKK